MIEEERASGSRLFLVDGGDFTGTQEGAFEARGHFMLEMMAHLGYDAVTLGVTDLALGPEMLSAIAASETGVPIVSANLALSGDGSRPFGDEVVVERGGLKVGITGILIPSATGFARIEKAGFAVTDAETAVRPLLESLRGRCDLVVLLANGDLRATQGLGERLRGLVDVVVVGDARGGRGLVQPEHGGAVFLTMGARGISLGRARVALREGGGIERIVGDEIVLVRERPEHEEVDRIVDEFEDRLNEIMRSHQLENARHQVAGDGDAFLGVGECSSCHQAEYLLWQETPHASAFQTLVDAGRDALPECVGCHVTGHGDPSGYSPVGNDATKLINVQCEVCHDKGTRHARDGSFGKSRLMNACPDCHDEGNSPDFDPEVYWLMIEH